MLPGEQETRRKLRKEYAKDFHLARDVLELAYQVLNTLCGDEPCRYGPVAKAVCVGAFTKMCNQYRSIHALCELGLTQDAGILLRAMFEALLRLDFILCESPPVLEEPAPNDRLTVDFRAKLYFAEGAIAREKKARMLKENATLRSHGVRLEPEADRCLEEATSLVGQCWIDWLSSRSMFGLGVEGMARKLGWLNEYDSVYRLESGPIHATDFEQFLDRDEDGAIVPTLFPDTETTTLPLVMASEFLLLAAKLTSERFQLGYGQRIAELRNSI